MCGSGGVGKTTLAAALALSAVVNQGGKVLVLTVDPAQAPGRRARRRRPRQRRRRGCPTAAFDAVGVEPRGELWAAMLDTKAGWDELIRRHAPDAKVRESVLSNPLYQNITSRFVHSHDYLAMEQLHEVHATGDYDLVVVDTPPSRNALDVLDAPSRMVEFFGSRLLQVAHRAVPLAAVQRGVEAVHTRSPTGCSGRGFLQDIAEFFILFQAMEKGFVARAREVEALLGDPRTAFVVVSTLEAAPAHEAAYLARELAERDYQLGAIIANRVMPTGADLARPRRRAPSGSARRVDGDGSIVADVAAALGARRPTPTHGRRRRARRGRRPGSTRSRSSPTREAERRAELAALAPQVLDVEALRATSTTCPGLLGHRRAICVDEPSRYGQTRTVDGLARRARSRTHIARP